MNTSEKNLELIEIEESFDPSTQIHIEVRRKAVSKVWISESAFESGLYERMFDAVGDLEAVQTRIVSATTNGNGCVSPKVLQALDQFLCSKGDESWSLAALRKRYADLKLPVKEA